MSLVHVAFPITRVKTRLSLFKGRPWSIIEHLILERLCRGPLAASELAGGFNLHDAIVDESLRKLMQAEWVGLDSSDTDHLRFKATPFGVAAASREVLPAAERFTRRQRWQLFDRVYGHVFGVGQLEHCRLAEFERWPIYRRTQILEPILLEGEYRRDELMEVALEDDERLIGVDPTNEYAVDRVALVKVVDGQVEGLPKDRPFEDLEKAILAAAEKGLSKSAPRRRRRARSFRNNVRGSEIWREVQISREDFLFGGNAHEKALRGLLGAAKSRVIIHSTFLQDMPFRKLLPMMIAAVERKVTVDILFGQNKREQDDAHSRRPTAAEVVRELRRDRQLRMYRERLRLHPESTRSHAKFIIADPSRRGSLIALVGSCNWLDSPFESVEASVFLRDPAIVRDVLHCLMRLAEAGSGVWPELATELFRLGQALPGDPSRRPNGRATLVVGDQHNNHVLRARDKAERSLLLTSNKLGRQFDVGALIPLARACEKRDMRVSMLYSRLRGISKPEASEFHRAAKTSGISLVPILNPKVHAKLLAWDRNDAVITSQNWLSADPGYTPLATEMGVAVQCPGAGTWVIQDFEQCLGREKRRSK